MILFKADTDQLKALTALLVDDESAVKWVNVQSYDEGIFAVLLPRWRGAELYPNIMIMHSPFFDVYEIHQERVTLDQLSAAGIGDFAVLRDVVDFRMHFCTTDWEAYWTHIFTQAAKHGWAPRKDTRCYGLANHGCDHCNGLGVIFASNAHPLKQVREAWEKADSKLYDGYRRVLCPFCAG